jgi:hypothetical protein
MKLLDWFRDRRALVKAVAEADKRAFGCQLHTRELHARIEQLTEELYGKPTPGVEGRLDIYDELNPYIAHADLERGLLNTKEPKKKWPDELEPYLAAQMMGMALSTLQHYVYIGRGPKAHKDSGGSTFYRLSEIREYLDQKKKNMSRRGRKKNG